MKQFIKAYWKTVLFFVLVGLVGGFFVGLYMLESYPADIQAQLLDDMRAEGLDFLPANVMLGLLTAVQSAGYGLVCGALGIALARRVGLWKDERRIARGPLAAAIVVSVLSGAVMILADVFVFGEYSAVIARSYDSKPTLPYMIASIIYGGILEEVMLRLFMMSLIAWILHMLFTRKREHTPTAILAVANVAAALLFAAGHLPATLLMIGDSPMILARCFLLNGGIGLAFGWLYRKYGLRYAMIAHGGCHVVSKLIWILFL